MFGPQAGLIQPGGIPISGPGASAPPIDIGPLGYLQGLWGNNSVTLNWGTPEFDPSKYQLTGYLIEQQLYGPNSTVAQSNLVANIGPNTNQTTLPFTQTYQYNTGGDIAGYRVTPVFRNLQTGASIHNYGGIGIKTGQSYGTFGVGP